MEDKNHINSMNTYFDNAATSFPKPTAVAGAVTRYLNDAGGPYGRSAYPRAMEVSRTVEKARNKVADMLGVSDSSSILFTHNATHGINLVLNSIVSEGNHILISPLEHNAVMRPLEYLKESRHITYEILPHFENGLVDVDAIKRKITSRTSLIILCHQSNVNGLTQPVQMIKSMAGEIPVLLDAAQSMGRVAVLPEEWGIEYVCFTGHKGLLGPTGTGGIYAKDTSLLKPLIYGGTGSSSDSYVMPEFVPDRLEAGTPNCAGIFGLLGALENQPVPAHTQDDFYHFLDEMKIIKGINVFCAGTRENQGELVSFTLNNLTSSQVAHRLFEQNGIETRAGLHCAPLAHRTLHTLPQGTVRIAPSPYHCREDFQFLLHAIQMISNNG